MVHHDDLPDERDTQCHPSFPLSYASPPFPSPDSLVPTYPGGEGFGHYLPVIHATLLLAAAVEPAGNRVLNGVSSIMACSCSCSTVLLRPTVPDITAHTHAHTLTQK
ncbi:hypothetical protein P167DRAFT_540299 [Morchella conica CCBAS932]|uniref:Uncharacterized protein n=1 Tax=Morchella conica CCBAS932 TaxID=1392247 RepID=A0A3N4KD11_9PEZI|nr:hypothetical protein P167DRAFT_540299 [Morchella conica CCBAS932]